VNDGRPPSPSAGVEASGRPGNQPRASPKAPAKGVQRVRELFRKPTTWLVLLVLSYFSVSFYFESTLYLGLQHTVGNLPVFMQALSSTVHGYIPMYESQDCEGKLRCSFLLVHPGFVLYAMAPIYALSPTPFTLFAIQSLGVALAAVPLYVLTRTVTGSGGKALLAAGLYLVWAPILAATLYGWWLESLLPLELLTVAACWELRKFRWGLAAAALAFATFEVGSVYGFLLGAFFLVPWVGAALRNALTELRSWRAGAQSLWASIRHSSVAIFQGLRLRAVRYTLLLMGVSLLAYVLVFYFMNEVGPRLLGAMAPPVPSGLSGLFFNSSAPRNPSLFETIVHPGLVLTASATPYNAEYWLILFALLGFLPLLSPRSLVISLPWIGFTFLALSNRYSVIGVYPAGVAAVPLFIGVAYGLRRVPLFEGPTPAPALLGPRVRLPRPRPPLRFYQRRRRQALWAALIGSAVVANLLLSPVDPILAAVGAELGPAFVSPYFFSSEPAAYQYGAIEKLVALVPYGATVAAPPLLAPFIINDVHGYVLTNKHTPQWNNQSRLPYNLTGGPYFVLVAGSGGYLPPALSASLTNTTSYNPRGYVPASAVGPVVLYERGFSGTADQFGSTAGLFPSHAGLGSGFALSRDGYASYATNPKFIGSWPNASKGGTILTSELPFLPVGSYTITIESRLVQLHSPGRSAPVVFGAGVQAFGHFRRSSFFRAANYTLDSWSSVTMRFTTNEPVLDPKLSFTLFSLDFQLAVASIVVNFTPASS
jgi:uncharacterized membrane protein